MEKREERRKLSLVSGASSGIGRAIAVREARAGRNLLINYAGNEEGAKETERLIHEAAPEAEVLLFRADVSEEEAVREMVDAAVERFGAIDVLVNNAGITRDNLLLRMSAEDFDSVLRINLRSVFLLSKYAGKYMLKKRSGRIINISSVVGLHGNIGQVNYAASKAGIIGITKTLAREYAGRNITVNAVAPGFIETRMTETLPEKIKESMLSEIPLGRFGKPEDIANAVSFLASDESSYITGQILLIDGGMRA